MSFVSDLKVSLQSGFPMRSINPEARDVGFLDFLNSSNLREEDPVLRTRIFIGEEWGGDYFLSNFSLLQSMQCLCAWQTVKAVMFTMSLYEHPRERSLTGFLSPCSSGPMARAPASLSVSLYEMFADSRLGKIKTFASPWIELFGHFFAATSGTRAASTCISPSAITFLWANLNIEAALFTLSAFGWSADPFVEKERNAIRGSIPNIFAVSAVSSAMSTRSCASGSTVMAASAKSSNLFSKTMKKIPETLWKRSSVLIIWRAGRIVSDVENVVPLTIPSTSSSWTIIVPK